ncbi:MAG TPA: hypothetical protein PKW33_12895 [Anaerolineaceae bacterium]|nr:hypothetical protein [Anaerolineaceae bacterium]HPN52480.1 hypothetical protein [Anaerolineaceae bacterium]
MKIKRIFLLILTGLLLTACAEPLSFPTALFQKQPSNDPKQICALTVEETNVIVNDKVKPAVALLLVKGSVSSQCSNLQMQTNPANAKKEIYVTIAVSPPATPSSSAAAVPFDISMKLLNLTAGDYKLFINDEQQATFTMP